MKNLFFPVLINSALVKNQANDEVPFIQYMDIPQLSPIIIQRQAQPFTNTIRENLVKFTILWCMVSTLKFFDPINPLTRLINDWFVLSPEVHAGIGIARYLVIPLITTTILPAINRIVDISAIYDPISFDNLLKKWDQCAFALSLGEPIIGAARSFLS